VLVVVGAALASCSSGGSMLSAGPSATRSSEHPTRAAPVRAPMPVPVRNGSRDEGDL